jgi:hypothetical protein
VAAVFFAVVDFFVTNFFVPVDFFATVFFAADFFATADWRWVCVRFEAALFRVVRLEGVAAATVRRFRAVDFFVAIVSPLSIVEQVGAAFAIRWCARSGDNNTFCTDFASNFFAAGNFASPRGITFALTAHGNENQTRNRTQLAPALHRYPDR